MSTAERELNLFSKMEELERSKEIRLTGLTSQEQAAWFEGSEGEEVDNRVWELSKAYLLLSLLKK
uniref:Uncharacterized protein n=1 Tax=Utricularia reniformis TaxID=192314 RepID=A0A1Y0B4J0_9LAMI|nr:hypothetical protein AEK19_MT2159 [Utricularia reniformis]ART32308.1 hypothetical protein AEK19_MT2159 [Utricularia reniformis]